MASLLDWLYRAATDGTRARPRPGAPGAACGPRWMRHLRHPVHASAQTLRAPGRSGCCRPGPRAARGTADLQARVARRPEKRGIGAARRAWPALTFIDGAARARPW